MFVIIGLIAYSLFCVWSFYINVDGKNEDSSQAPNGDFPQVTTEENNSRSSNSYVDVM